MATVLASAQKKWCSSGASMLHCHMHGVRPSGGRGRCVSSCCWHLVGRRERNTLVRPMGAGSPSEGVACCSGEPAQLVRTHRGVCSADHMTSLVHARSKYRLKFRTNVHPLPSSSQTSTCCRMMCSMP